ncbi:Ferroporti-1 [Pseudomassariella vexata]|uniref:Solute carrier family 40 member n=1 Tax=Pseudomassariella vexata TaxID=1141098 RepID=A0A1Y2DSN6_9PEZI|nr:Ferroporti-1 [Pseudomassariella vexata]ORY62293.1 Ferroporti-1 [Pseudomassariella vexata]
MVRISGEAVELANEGSLPAQEVPQTSITRSQAVKLYISHALSTWNARGYEFATILFTASAYPDTLVAAAIRMTIVYFAMILFSSVVGRWVQKSPNRLRTLLATIFVNRASVLAGAFFWLLILSQEDLIGSEGRFSLAKNDTLKHILFVVAMSFGIIERLSASGNLISMERDWVVTVAAPSGRPYDLTHLNAVMRRIDLVCKLISPILISVVISALDSVRIGVVYTALTSMVSIPIEAISARRVWDDNPSLRVPKEVPPEGETPPLQSGTMSWRTQLRQYLHDSKMYFSTTVWIPSMALAMLYFNVITWRATFITYLINVGYSLNTITIARTIGSLFEISSTVATPRGVEYLGKSYRSVPQDEHESEVGLVSGEDSQSVRDTRTLVGLQRFGLWGFTWQVFNTAPVVVALFAITAPRVQDGGINVFASRMVDRAADYTLPAPPVGWSIVLFSFLAISRFGVWIYDLTTQQLTQTLVPSHQRSSFAGVETSMMNIVQLFAGGAAIAYPKTDQFVYLASASFVVVVLSWLMYASWVYRQRGHLVHWEKLGQGLFVGGR